MSVGSPPSVFWAAGHAAVKWPADINISKPENQDGTPVVTLTIPGNLNSRTADSTTTPATVACPERNHDGSVEVTFTLLAGMFDGNVTALMWDPAVGGATGSENTTPPVTATSAVATIEAGGRKGDNSITIKIAEAPAEAVAAADGAAERDSTSVAYQTGGANNSACNAPAAQFSQTISFKLPEIVGLNGTLDNASKAKDMMKSVTLRAESRIVSGAFTDGFLTGDEKNKYTEVVLKSRDAVTVSITDPNTKHIVIKEGDNAFKAVKEADPKTGYVELATVTVSTSTKHVTKEKSETKAKSVYRLQSTVAGGALSPTPATDGHIYEAAKSQAEEFDTLFGLDGKPIDAGLRGTLTVDATGTRDLFNDDDMLFIDYDGDKEPGGSEGIDIDGDSGMGTALSVDPDASESFKGGVGSFKVYYKAGGKETINHGAEIHLMANVDYSNPSATDEAEKKTMTTLNFEGVGNPVMAYAIPDSDNAHGDKGNVRIRCEGSKDCRVFLECWGDAGTDTRMFGELMGGVPANGVERLSSAMVEEVSGRMPDSRHSCRILSVGKVTVQQLTRDGHSDTLVNNTYVGGGM